MEIDRQAERGPAGSRDVAFDVIVPYTQLDGTADLPGPARGTRRRRDSARPAFRPSINLHGAPALALREFSTWKQDLIVGASLQVSPPWGQYDADRLVNIGSNRWSFKPEVGISKATGPWTLEAQAAATFFTDNDDFYGGNTRSQRPALLAAGPRDPWLRFGQVDFRRWHLFRRRTLEINGALNNDLQQNWRVGATLAIPVNRLNSIKFYASSGVSARTGNNYDAIGVAWQYRWGAGL